MCVDWDAGKRISCYDLQKNFGMIHYPYLKNIESP